MIFTLEALQAQKGDSLILHYGDPQKPRFIVIDGGPDPVFDISLSPRLDQLREKFPDADGRLSIEMAMVSHIDDDHINGILAWFRSLREKQNNGEALPDRIQTLWFNSFDDLLGNSSEELRSVLSTKAAKTLEGNAEGADFSADPRQARHSAAVVASVRQGRELRSVATTLTIPLNLPFTGLVMPPANDRTVNLAGGLKLHVLGPTLEQAKALQEEWEKDVKKKPNLGVEAAAFADRSVANLSSIVVLAEFTIGPKTLRILLTGDARGDFVWDGLIQAGFLRDREDKFHLDILKMPHHGSNRNMTQEFLEHITADHYVISADGEDDNPDHVIFGWMADARGADPYTIHITNKKLMNPKKGGHEGDISAQVTKAINDSASVAVNRTVVFREKDALSFKVDLGSDAVDF
jgi:hypothetical protein